MMEFVFQSDRKEDGKREKRITNYGAIDSRYFNKRRNILLR